MAEVLGIYLDVQVGKIYTSKELHIPCIVWVQI